MEIIPSGLDFVISKEKIEEVWHLVFGGINPCKERDLSCKQWSNQTQTDLR